MVDKDYKRAREAAVKELEDLLQLQQRTEQRIVNLRNMISSLDSLSGVPLKKPETPRLTDAVRSIFKAAASNEFLNAGAVRHGLLGMGFKDGDYSNFLASIHVILRRLEKKGELERGKSKTTGQTVYRRTEKADYLAEL
jgi:hypothetical protein